MRRFISFAAISLCTWIALPFAYADPPPSNSAARIFLEGQELTCALAQEYASNNSKMATLDQLSRDLVYIQHQTCVAALYNEANPADPMIVVAAPVQMDSTLGPTRYFYDILSVRDVETIVLACGLAAKETFAIFDPITVLDINDENFKNAPLASLMLTYEEYMTKAGCSAVEDSFKEDNIFILSVPVEVVHLRLLIDLLKKNNLGKVAAPLEGVANFVEQQAKAVADKLAEFAVVVASTPKEKPELVTACLAQPWLCAGAALACKQKGLVKKIGKIISSC